MKIAPLFCLLLIAVSPSPSQTTAPPANAAAADFAQLARYRDANKGTSAKVVFLGDSITDYWGSHSGTWFPHSGWVNRGIGGQTTSQLLLRERNDALNLHPRRSFSKAPAMI